MKRTILLILTLHFISIKSWSQDFSIYQSPQDWVIAKNYYATFMLWKNPNLYASLLTDSSFQKMLSERQNRLLHAADYTTVEPILKAFKWSDQELIELSASLKKAYNRDTLWKDYVLSMQQSKKYALLSTAEPTEFLTAILCQDAYAANYAIDVYLGAKAPNYPRIDSISFDVQHPAYPALLQDIRQDIVRDISQSGKLFFSTALLAVRALEINERWDAAQLEPLADTENQATLANIEKTDFTAYPYAMLLTLGAGPESIQQAISPGGILRCRQAARSYFEGQAPFIMVSGGRVHPYKTKFIEALEMKRYLVEVLQVPADAVLIDPHARHTTTNLRNASRIMLQAAFPKDKYAIVNSSKSHIDAVEKMAARCMKELGYVPYSLGRRISDVIIEFLPDENAFIIDWDEPLDP